MSNPLGSFIWYELMTDDAVAAAQFYRAVVGWSFTAPPAEAPVAYWHITRSDGGSAGGMLQLSAESQAQGAHPAWIPYLHVADVAAAAAAIEADGGRVLMPKVSIEVGDFAMVTDPAGVPFYIMRPIAPAEQPDAISDVFAPDKPQHMRWNDLVSPDQAGAMAFYARHFGFAYPKAMPLGPLGEYRFIEHHGQTLGGIMPQQPGQPAQWLSYIGVPSAQEAKAAIEAHGGTVMMGPHEVPGGDWVVVARDPRGAVFGVVGPLGA